MRRVLAVGFVRLGVKNQGSVVGDILNVRIEDFQYRGPLLRHPVS